jgi:hypothetical protein
MFTGSISQWRSFEWSTNIENCLRSLSYIWHTNGNQVKIKCTTERTRTMSSLCNSRCHHTVSCQTMSLMSDRRLCSTQTVDDQQQMTILYDHDRCSYQLLTWHYCQASLERHEPSLTVLVRETSHVHGWIGTLTTKIDNQGLTWINNLDHRQYQLYLTEQIDSIVTHFEIQSINDPLVSNEHLLIRTWYSKWPCSFNLNDDNLTWVNTKRTISM